jgi:hypothetical protein
VVFSEALGRGYNPLGRSLFKWFNAHGSQSIRGHVETARARVAGNVFKKVTATYADKRGL